MTQESLHYALAGTSRFTCPANMQPFSAIGVDGCRDGWIAAISAPGQAIRWQFHASIQELINASPTNAVILVDMIIGLPDQSNPTRTCDQLARQILRPHGSRVFPAPPQEALDAPNYKAACAAARAATGKAISKQCWYLFPKIRELESITDPRMRESHPEVVFTRMNQGTAVAASKKTLTGQNTRLRLLRDALPGSIQAFLQADLQLPAVQYLADDCIDALALCAAARAPHELRRLPEDPQQKAIWY